MLKFNYVYITHICPPLENFLPAPLIPMTRLNVSFMLHKFVLLYRSCDSSSSAPIDELKLTGDPSYTCISDVVDGCKSDGLKVLIVFWLM